MINFTVIKCDHNGEEQLRYSGHLLSRGPGWVCIEAPFSFRDRDLGYVCLRKGDLFTEWFYADRWYNIFRVADKDTRALKGWYCNLTRPARIEEDWVSSDDLALDFFVDPDGATLLLDEDEYEALNLPAAEQAAVQAAIDTLRQLVATQSGPFADLWKPHDTQA